ncbi:hypothetical protein [Vibrio sp. TBV020]|uniref:hypothetical protein n=1 Tax=Vibrio sp. TBV020 TaxID=3137398 RepID=UPI0038CD8E6E
MLVSVFLFGLKGMTAEMGIAVAASCVFLAFANLDKFTKSKGAGFEAELREAVSEANASIHELKELAKPLIRTNFEILAQANRMQGSNFEKTHDLFDQLQSLQVKFQLEDTETEKSKNSYIVIHAWDMVYEILDDVQRVELNENYQRSKDTIGQINFETMPDIDAFLTQVETLNLSKKDEFKLEKLREYKLKYKL